MAARALFSRRALLLPAAPAAALAASSSAPSASRSEASAEPPAAANGPAPAEFLGVFVSRESAAALRERFPAKFGGASEPTEPLFVALKFHPTAAEREAFAPLLGRRAALQVAGYVEDARAQAVLVSVATEAGEPIALGEAPQFLTLSAADGLAGVNAGAASVLLERLRAAGKLPLTATADATEGEAEGETAEAEWTGELPAFESALLPLFNPFPAVEATVVRVADAPALSGTVCLSTAFDPESEACLAAPAKAECGFCKFMKAGPCGQQFAAWEDCLDRSKALGVDFIEHCGAQTLLLRDCIDANPEYYHVLNDGDEEEQKEEGKEDKQQQEEEKEKEEEEPKQQQKAQ